MQHQVVEDKIVQNQFSATLKAATLNSCASLIRKELFWQLNIISVVIMAFFITAQQNAQYLVQCN